MLRHVLTAMIATTLLMAPPVAAHPPMICFPDGSCTICGFAGCGYPLLLWKEKHERQLREQRDRGLWNERSLDRSPPPSNGGSPDIQPPTQNGASQSHNG
jgi:hypothetical protein